LAIRNRYSLLNYFYTLMFQASLTGGLIWQPTFFQYPSDSNLWDTHSTDNFMIGDALIVHPCLEPGVTQISAYFPKDLWYDWYFGSVLALPANQTVTLATPAVGLINVHIRGGYIIPRLDSSSKVNTAIDLRASNTTLVIAPDASGTATGTVIYDDGESLDTISAGKYTAVVYQFTQVSPTSATLTISVQEDGYTRAKNEFPYISMVMIYGCVGRPLTAAANGIQLVVLTEYNALHGTCWLSLDGQVQVDQPTNITIAF
jgi:alpha-glucosidase (family GH31 glycosyl hydrolase)